MRTLEWFDANPYAVAGRSRGASRMSVIFSRAPLRISLGGGGTDLPSYYREHGGFLVAGAIDKYVYMLIHTVFQRRYRMKYSETEEVDDVGEIRHPILRESAGAPLARATRSRSHRWPTFRPAPEWARPARSRSALLKGLAHARRTSITPGALAERACEIEIDILKEPCGKQDPYVAAHGGICAYTFSPDGSVDVEPLELSEPRRCGGCGSSCCSSTPARRARPRPSSPIRTTARRSGDAEMLENLHRTKEMGRQSRELLVAGDLIGYAELMHEHWQNKRARSPGMATERIDELYTLARRSGAIGGKLVGAGGGGFLLVYARNPPDTRQAMAAAGAQSCSSTSSSRARIRTSTRERRPSAANDTGCGSASSAAG